ncbi:hypothetical protein BGW42_005764 [Actinomortierella wolfii]|nr:hypothetical protein BGW42_005764 [Actinomortierella wolfii]
MDSFFYEGIEANKEDMVTLKNLIRFVCTSKSFPMVFSQHHVEFLDMLKRLKPPLRGAGTSVLQEE